MIRCWSSAPLNRSSFCHSGKVCMNCCTKIRRQDKTFDERPVHFQLTRQKICHSFRFHLGVGLAVMETVGAISPIVDASGSTTSAGTVSAGYQNFLICVEMLFAAIALRYAFPYQVRFYIFKWFFVFCFHRFSNLIHCMWFLYRFMHRVEWLMCMADQLLCNRFQAVWRYGCFNGISSISSTIFIIIERLLTCVFCVFLLHLFRKQWTRRTLWRMQSIISIHSINNTLNTALVCTNSTERYVYIYKTREFFFVSVFIHSQSFIFLELFLLLNFSLLFLLIKLHAIFNALLMLQCVPISISKYWLFSSFFLSCFVVLYLESTYYFMFMCSH